MSAGLIGPVAVSAAIALAAVAVLSARRWALVASSAASTIAVVTLAAALLSADFSLAYVSETTSLATPLPYRLAALWGGMDGSMLFYSALLSGVAAIGVRGRFPIRVSALAAMGLLLLTLLFANPFMTNDLPPVDGQGLLAILQHPAMIYHPPILYLGLTVLIVPFASTAGQVVTGGDRRHWLAGVRRWLYVAWVALTIGMAAGANWAFVELGWGGYWAWDPVENTALMPWLAVTAFLHTSRLEEATGRWRRANVVFASLPFAMSLVGVYLTRSGATGSIHSFAEDPVVGRLLLISAALAGSFVAWLTFRGERGEAWGRFRIDRSSWLALDAVALSVTLVFVAAGSIYPAVSSVFFGETVGVDTRFFVTTVLPLAVVIAAALGVALGAPWPWLLAAGLITAVLVVALAGPGVGVALLAPAAGSLTALVVGMVRRRPPRRLVPALLAHVGMCVFLVAVAASSFGADHSGSMRPGETVVVGGHEVTLLGVETGETDRFVYARARFDVDGNALSPEIRAYEDQNVPVAEPALRSTPVGDVIVAISLLFPDGETVEVSVYARPLVWWVWVGAALIGLAGLTALSGRGEDGARRRRSATRELQPGGTTTGSSAR